MTGEWISVKDRVPDYWIDVLGYSLDEDEDDYIVAHRTPDSLAWECHDMAPCLVDYWVPLPEPPKDL